MLNRINEAFDFQATALKLRAERQKMLAANIVNADTPGYKATDFDFSAVLAQAAGSAGAGTAALGGATAPARTHAGHIGAGAATGDGGVAAADIKYRQPAQAALDNNSVDLDLERAQFAENAVRYEATLRFINSQVKTLQAAMQGVNGG